MKRYRVGGSRRTYTMDEARARAQRVFERTGNVVAIEQAARRRRDELAGELSPAERDPLSPAERAVRRQVDTVERIIEDCAIAAVKLSRELTARGDHRPLLLWYKRGSLQVSVTMPGPGWQLAPEQGKGLTAAIPFSRYHNWIRERAYRLPLELRRNPARRRPRASAAALAQAVATLAADRPPKRRVRLPVPIAATRNLLPRAFGVAAGVGLEDLDGMHQARKRHGRRVLGSASGKHFIEVQRGGRWIGLGAFFTKATAIDYGRALARRYRKVPVRYRGPDETSPALQANPGDRPTLYHAYATVLPDHPQYGRYERLHRDAGRQPLDLALKRLGRRALKGRSPAAGHFVEVKRGRGWIPLAAFTTKTTALDYGQALARKYRHATLRYRGPDEQLARRAPRLRSNPDPVAAGAGALDASRVTIEKYGNRNWAVYVDGQLLAVTVYKKGARTVREFILAGGLQAAVRATSDATYRQNPSARGELAAELSSAARRFKAFTGGDAQQRIKVNLHNTGAALAVGPVLFVGYETVRDGERQRYIHQFTQHARPLLAASSDGRSLFFVGGRYRFTERGITDRKQ